MLDCLRRRLPFKNALATNWPSKVPLWTIASFCVTYLLVFLPCVVFVVGIHNDYEMIWYKTWGPFHTEADSLLAIGRPVAAILTNITVLPAMEIADFRWVRLFSIATVWVLGTQLLIICICHLAIKPRDALALALCIFLVPSFLYSVLASAAWAPHLISIFFALWAYGMLSRTNVQAMLFHGLVRRREYRSFVPQMLSYMRLRQVVLACVILQVALYDYPPQAMLLTCLPIATLFFSKHAPAYRITLALRDLGFLLANVAIYAVTAKLIYIPMVRLFIYRYSEAWYVGYRTSFDIRIADSYRYAFNWDPSEALKRLGGVTKVAGDLWFLPQINAHVYVAALILIVALTVAAWHLWGRQSDRFAGFDAVQRLRVDGWNSNGVLAIAIAVACFVLAGSAVLGSGGGFITYRTIAMPIAVACVVTLFAVRYIGEFTAALAGLSSRLRSEAGDVAIAVLTLSAAGAMLYNNYLTVRLGQNEHAYFTSIMQEAMARNVHTMALVDPRPFILPEENPVVFDQQGRWVTPYEVGCFSGYCLQTDAILRIVASELGLNPKKIKILIARADEFGPGVNCDLLRSPTKELPDNATERGRDFVKTVREAPSSMCVTYDLKWHDIALDLAAKSVK